MARKCAPATPGLATPSPQMRRAFTAPLKLAAYQGPQTIENEPDSASDEILFWAQEGKIVSFSPSSKYSSVRTRSTARATSGATSDEEAVGTLPCGSSTESLLAVGIYISL